MTAGGLTEGTAMRRRLQMLHAALLSLLGGLRDRWPLMWESTHLAGIDALLARQNDRLGDRDRMIAAKDRLAAQLGDEVERLKAKVAKLQAEAQERLETIAKLDADIKYHQARIVGLLSDRQAVARAIVQATAMLASAPCHDPAEDEGGNELPSGNLGEKALRFCVNRQVAQKAEIKARNPQTDMGIPMGLKAIR